MKNKTKLFVVFLLVAVACIALSACATTYTVNFYADGQLVQSVSVLSAMAELPEAPVKDGYSFAGWFLDENSWTQPFVQSQSPSLDSTVNVYAKYVPYTIELTCNDVNKIKETDTLSAQTFGAKATDSDGQELQVEVNVVSGKQQAGKTVSLRLSATGKFGVVATKDLLSVRVYGKPTITRDETLLGVKVTDTADNEFLGISAKDSFGEELFVTTTIDGEQTQGQLLTVTSTATDIMGNVETLTFTIGVYGMPTITANTEISEISITDKLNAEFFSATAKDSFGNDLNVAVTTTPQNYTAGDTITVTLSATDNGKNTSTIAIDNVKVIYASTLFTYDGRTLTGLTKQGKKLEEIIIPEYFTAIASNAFESNDNLKSIEIPASVTSIGDYAFKDCSNLTSIEIPSSVMSIGEYAFCDCSKLTSIEIPSSVTLIGVCAFYNCSKLTSVTFGDNSQLESIGVCAFSGCSKLTSIEIPSSVMSIGDYAFEDCSSLTAVHITDIAAWCNIEFYDSPLGCYANPLHYAQNLYLNDELVTELEIPSTVTKIKNYVFFGYSSLTSIEIPDSVTSIGEAAFLWCIGLTSIEIPDSVTSIGNSAFYGCSSLTNIVIPSSVTSIGEDAFYNCSNLTSVTFGENSQLTSIGSSAFKDCSSLISIVIPASVISIKSYVFSGCSNLIIYCEAESKPSDWSYNWNSSCPVVWDCNNNDVAADGNIYAVIDGIRYALKDGVATVVRQSSSIVSAAIPSSVTYKGTSYSVTTIGEEAFYGCSSLTSIVIPNSVTSIGYQAFSRCWILTSIEIPASVTSIGFRAFSSCSSLTNITFEDTTTWYRTSSWRNWGNQTGGTLTSVTDASTNAKLFTDTYSDYYWYKK